MPSPSETISQFNGALASHLAQCSSVTTADYHGHYNGGHGTGNYNSLAWDTLRTNLQTNCLTTPTSIATARLTQDYLDTCPTLRYRGTP